MWYEREENKARLSRFGAAGDGTLRLEAPDAILRGIRDPPNFPFD